MVEVAMGIIINAGDARTCAADAMQAELRGDRAAADAKLHFPSSYVCRLIFGVECYM